MDALVLWREAALRGKLARSPSRSPSPGSEFNGRSRLKDIEEESPYFDGEGRHSARSSTDMSGTTVSEGGTPDGQTMTPRPSSSSWVRWWSRSRQAETAQRPDLRPMNTAPSSVVGRSVNVVCVAELLTVVSIHFLYSNGVVGQASMSQVRNPQNARHRLPQPCLCHQNWKAQLQTSLPTRRENRRENGMPRRCG